MSLWSSDLKGHNLYWLSDNAFLSWFKALKIMSEVLKCICVMIRKQSTSSWITLTKSKWKLKFSTSFPVSSICLYLMGSCLSVVCLYCIDLYLYLLSDCLCPKQRAFSLNLFNSTERNKQGKSEGCLFRNLITVM